MKPESLRRLFEEELSHKPWLVSWDRENQKLNITLSPASKKVHISIAQVLHKLKQNKHSSSAHRTKKLTEGRSKDAPTRAEIQENEQAEARQIVAETIEQIQIVADSIQAREALFLPDKEQHIFPVLRSRSFPEKTDDDRPLLFEEHTAESKMYFAVDLGRSYTLIDADLCAASGWTAGQLKEKALFNLRRLEVEPKIDEVAGNTFYFISPQDGYAASRILNQPLLRKYAEQATGDFCLAIPHQDVLIMADLRNDHGYDILGQMAMRFYSEGDMPITPLSFQYKDGNLEPIFILAQNRPRQDKQK